jgi:hypothetical protein
VEEITGRILNMCGKIRHKSEKSKIYKGKVGFTSDMLSTDEDRSKTKSNGNFVKIGQIVGHLQKRSGT